MMPERPASNADIAALLDRVADLLEAQDAGRYRVAAYRRAAATIRAHPRPLAEILEAGGTKAVDALPTIGPTMAAHVSETSGPRRGHRVVRGREAEGGSATS